MSIDMAERLRSRANQFGKLMGNYLYYAEGDAILDREAADTIERLRSGGVGVRVKELEWSDPYETEDGSYSVIAISPIGRYIASGRGWFLVGQSQWNESAAIDEAKAAAQADFEQRILSALSAAPPPPVSGAGEPFGYIDRQAIDFFQNPNNGQRAVRIYQESREGRYIPVYLAPSESINAEMLEALKNVHDWIGYLPIPTEGATALMMKLRALIAKATAGKAAEPEAGR